MTSQAYDLIAVGAGPGGYVAAARSAQLGLRTALIEKQDRLGGTCLLWGCIPTKALIHAAEVWQLCKGGAKTFGVTCEGAVFDWGRVQKRKDVAITKGSKGVELLMQEKGVTVIHGRAEIDRPGRLFVHRDGDEPLSLGAPRLVLATGSTTTQLPGITIDGERVLTSDHLLHIPQLPESLIVLGAGAVGVEFAAVMNAFGARVTLVEMLPHILPLEDPECSEEVAKYLKRKGMKIFTGSRATGVERTETGVRVVLVPEAGGEETVVEASHLLVAVGRSPVTADLHLERTAVRVNRRGYVHVDAMMETAEKGIYAIGDIVPTPQLAHLASREALVAVGHAGDRPLRPIRYDQVPSCTYSTPEVASVGLTETEARERGHQVRTGKFSFAALGKASILNEPHGFVKIVGDGESDAVLGVHMVGPRVTELVAEAASVIGGSMDLDAWSAIIHPHPTLSEALLEAVHAALGEPLHGVE